MGGKSSIRKLINGNQEAYFDIFEKYKSLVFYYCMDILNNREDAEDILQETFVEFLIMSISLMKIPILNYYLFLWQSAAQ